MCKDLSRLGRNNALVAYYTEIYFVDRRVRFVALNDGIDTGVGDNEIMAFKSVINEYYARDTSKKIRSTMRNMAIKGEFKASHAPYGYRKDPEDKHHLLVDKETGPIVQKMFQMASEGIAAHSIRVWLTKQEILTPRAYVSKKYGTYQNLPATQQYPTQWCLTTVLHILKNREYLGHIVSQKQTTKSFKNHSCVNRPKEEWVEVRDVHEALVDERTFETVQGFVKTKRGAYSILEGNLFAGLLKCVDCGRSLSYSGASKSRSSPYYNCNLYRRFSNRCTSHYITAQALYECVLGDIRIKAAFAKDNEDNLLDYARHVADKSSSQDVRRMQSDLEKSRGRCAELDAIIKRLVEQNALGMLADARFVKLTGEYEAEQEALRLRIADIQQSLGKLKADNDNALQFHEIIRQYTDIRELTVPILHKLISRIDVYNPVGAGKSRTQKVDIHYRCYGVSPCDLTSQ